MENKKTDLQIKLDKFLKSDMSSIYVDRYIFKATLVIKESLESKSYTRYYKTKPEIDKAVSNMKYYSGGKAIGYIKVYELVKQKDIYSDRVYKRPHLIETHSVIEE